MLYTIRHGTIVGKPVAARWAEEGLAAAGDPERWAYIPLPFTRETSGQHTMSAEKNKALVRRLLERLRNGWTPAVIEEFFAPSYRRHLTPTTAPLTREGQRERANRLRAAFPDATVTLEDIYAQGDRVAYRLIIRGTHQGAFQGIPPTGKTVTVSFTAIVRIEDGRLVEEWGGLDLFDLRQQLEAGVTAGPDSEQGQASDAKPRV
jgi:predicted ester cyclase